MKKLVVFPSLAALLLAGCATVPNAPMVNVMPVQGEDYGKFQADQDYCKGAARNAVAGQADDANNRAVGGALIGLAAGALVGSAFSSGHGYYRDNLTGVGAVEGTAVGAAVGADQSSRAGWSIQRQYDNVYAQCMYAHGAQVPGFSPQAVPPPGVPQYRMPPSQYYAPPPNY